MYITRANITSIFLVVYIFFFLPFIMRSLFLCISAFRLRLLDLYNFVSASSPFFIFFFFHSHISWYHNYAALLYVHDNEDVWIRGRFDIIFLYRLNCFLFIILVICIRRCCENDSLSGAIEKITRPKLFDARLYIVILHTSTARQILRSIDAKI